MFRGANKVSLDAKGRLAIPTCYRERIADACGGQLITTADPDHCLAIYPLPNWEEIEHRLMRLPSLDKEARRLQRLMVGYATDTHLDKNGRILLSAELREYARLEKQVMLVGQGGKFEVWDEPAWQDGFVAEGGDGSRSAELSTIVF